MHKLKISCILLSIALNQCSSLSNFKTAKVLNVNREGKADFAFSTGVICTGEYYASEKIIFIKYYPEIAIRYPIIPGIWEMGNKIFLYSPEYYSDSGIAFDLDLDEKFQLFNIGRFYLGIDAELEILLFNPNISGYAISSSLLATYDITDTVSITLAPKIKYSSQHWESKVYLSHNSYDTSSLAIGGAITLEISKNPGFLPELGIFYVKSSLNNSSYPVITFGVATKLSRLD